ncbi:hypothetical protein [Rhizobium sp. SAFR-030]|uniref:hypothetical protein n=1 Tax=Rhizobium sp. SAFR-030 TaxID=3387277 RepID=UPI003F813464
MIKDQAVLDGVLAPDELAMLQRVFDAALSRQGFARNSVEASLLASTIIELYVNGVREEDRLRQMIVAR